MFRSILSHALGALLCGLWAANAFALCDGALAVQVLGSGGPQADGRRASAGYLLWIRGRARLMVDAGGGTLTRFGASGARVRDLQLLALTHLHADHAGELPALLKSGYFSDRSRPLPLSGPTGGGHYPDLEGFLAGLFGPGKGAFRYLGGYLDGSDDLFRLERRTLDADRRGTLPVLSRDGLTVTATGVTHGPVPALAYRAELGGRSIVFSGDLNGDDAQFIDFARNADLLIMDHAVPENAGRIAANLHALPSEIGDIARQAGVKHLVLSHLMPRSERTLDSNLEIIQARYAGRVTVAEDLMCLSPVD
jgi:ribonuclease BN (tRNA processing enzyme)